MELTKQLYESSSIFRWTLQFIISNSSIIFSVKTTAFIIRVPTAISVELIMWMFDELPVPKIPLHLSSCLEMGIFKFCEDVIILVTSDSLNTSGPISQIVMLWRNKWNQFEKVVLSYFIMFPRRPILHSWRDFLLKISIRLFPYFSYHPMQQENQ